ncbi:MAG: class I SAM-dependent methyltransferase [Candidatus Lokiarchaeota archaeon]|nr:class I SAM-dependent methyltransferase [Candidatus Lokiarchaeota archaeon]
MSKKIYDILALDYHQKRFYPWKDFEVYFNKLIQKGVSFNGYNIDLGCANGRNFKIFLQSDVKLIGIDNSIEFLKISRNRLKTGNNYTMKERRSIELIQSDINSIPIRPEAVNNLFSIATIHHIKNIHKRYHALNQIYAILKDNGLLFLTLWRKYQKKYRYYFVRDWIKRLYSSNYRIKQRNLDLAEHGDKFIPWTISKENLTYNRFYHFYSRKELKKLVKNFVIKEIKKKGGPNKRDNFFVLVKKESEVKKAKNV